MKDKKFIMSLVLVVSSLLLLLVAIKNKPQQQAMAICENVPLIEADQQVAAFVIKGLAQGIGLNMNVIAREGGIEMVLDDRDNYERVLAFYKSLKDLPYFIELREFCMGTGCGEHFFRAFVVAKMYSKEGR